MRTLVAAILAIVVLLLLFGVIVRQPTPRGAGLPPGPRADPDALRRHVEFLAGETASRNVRHPGTLERAADYIKSHFESSGGRFTEQRYTAEGVPCRNLVVRFGTGEGPLVVIGAHYDVCGDLPGADDNASGSAGVLELARLLGARGCRGPVEIVAFSTEEPPHFGGPEMGSAVHARSLNDSGAAVRAMLCLEMIGFYTERQPHHGVLLDSLYPRTGDFAVVAGRWKDRELVREVKKAMNGASSVPIYGYSGPVEIGVDLSDHRNYWQHGYPAVMIGDTAFLRNPNYHTAADTPETLDYARMAAVVDGVLNAALTLSGLPGPL